MVLFFGALICGDECPQAPAIAPHCSHAKFKLLARRLAFPDEPHPPRSSLSPTTVPRLTPQSGHPALSSLCAFALVLMIIFFFKNYITLYSFPVSADVLKFVSLYFYLFIFGCAAWLEGS